MVMGIRRLSPKLIIRLGGMILLALVGLSIGFYVGDRDAAADFREWIILSASLFGGLVGFILTPYLVLPLFRFTLKRIREAPVSTLVASTVGLLLGLLVSIPLAWAITNLPGLWGDILPAVVSVIFAYLGAVVVLSREKELRQLFSFHVGEGDRKVFSRTSKNVGNGHIILDTSAIIDGRIADISRTGFVNGQLVVPQFVLDELQHIADSSDTLRRNRGRRGLEVLNRLQKEDHVVVQVVDIEIPDVAEVDGKLVKMAKKAGYPILTTDFNLNRVAELQGVQVLNINELANSLKPIVLPGEEMFIRIVQEGKESNQGVGFLDDGTMVVIEGGRSYINEEIQVVINRALQTAAGRIIFAHPRQK